MLDAAYRMAVGGCLLFSAQFVFAEDIIDSEKNMGISFSIKTQQQDYSLTSLNFVSAPPQFAALAKMKDRIKTSGNVQTASIQLSRRIIPGINVFGSIGQVKGETVAEFPALPDIRLPAIKVDANGMAYSLGAVAIARKEQHFATVRYIHTLYKPDQNTLNPDSHSNSITASVGTVTRAGDFSLGLMYQENKRTYIGNISTPLGDITADAELENKNKTSWLAEYRTALGKDMYLRSSVELGGRQGLGVAIIKRF